MIKIGILGSGSNGEATIDTLKRIPTFRLIGMYDPDPGHRDSLCREKEIHPFDDPNMLAELADAIDISAPLAAYPDLFTRAIKESKHVFLHDPFTGTNPGLSELLKLIGESRGVVQVSQPNRFNPAFMAAFPYIRSPKYIEFQRKIPYGQTAPSTSLVLQYLMHDIDLAIFLSRTNVRKSSISGVSLVSPRPDLVEARLEFNNGCVANFMINRVSTEHSHVCTLYQTGMTIRLDMVRHTADIQHLKHPSREGPGPLTASITTEKLLVTPSDPLVEELTSFHRSISHRNHPQVNLEDAFKAMEIALELQERLNWLSVN